MGRGLKHSSACGTIHRIVVIIRDVAGYLYDLVGVASVAPRAVNRAIVHGVHRGASRRWGVYAAVEVVAEVIRRELAGPERRGLGRGQGGAREGPHAAGARRGRDMGKVSNEEEEDDAEAGTEEVGEYTPLSLKGFISESQGLAGPAGHTRSAEPPVWHSTPRSSLSLRRTENRFPVFTASLSKSVYSYAMLEVLGLLGDDLRCTLKATRRAIHVSAPTRTFDGGAASTAAVSDTEIETSVWPLTCWILRLYDDANPATASTTTTCDSPPDITRRRIVVGVVGGAGAGKSTLCALLSSSLDAALEAREEGEASAVVSMDGYHLTNAVLKSRNLASEKGRPDTIDAAGLAADLGAIRDAAPRSRCSPSTSTIACCGPITSAPGTGSCVTFRS